MRYRLYSKIKNNTHFIPFIIDMPTLIDRISATYESGARRLVDDGDIEKEDMRQILEDSLRISAIKINDLLDTVKLEPKEES